MHDSATNAIISTTVYNSQIVWSQITSYFRMSSYELNLIICPDVLKVGPKASLTDELTLPNKSKSTPFSSVRLIWEVRWGVNTAFTEFEYRSNYNKELMVVGYII